MVKTLIVKTSNLLLAYVFSLLVIPFYIGPELTSNAQINAERVLLLLICFLFFFLLLKKRTYKNIRTLYIQNRVFFSLFSLFFIWRAISTVASGQIVSYFLYAYEIVSNFLIFIVFYIYIFNNKNHKTFFSVLYFSTIFVFVFSILEFSLQKNIFASLAPSDAGAAIKSSSIVRGSVYRVKSVFEHPLTLGHFCVMVLPIVLFSKISLFKFYKLVKIALAVSLIVMIFLTGSRMTMLSSIIILTIFIVTYGPKIKLNSGSQTRRSLFFIWPLLLFTPVIAINFIISFSGRSSFESYVRIAQVVNGLQVIEMRPLLGFGLGPAGMKAIESFGTAMKLWTENAATIDNWFLSVLLASGYPSLLLFIGMHLAVFLKLFKTYRKRELLLRTQSEYFSLWVGLSLSFTFGLAFMSILSIFTLHPLFYILLAALLRLDFELNTIAGATKC